MQLVNLYPQRQQKIGTFSGGMRQRFGIDQALLGSPKLIIVDEPTAGLDPTERIRFQNLLAEISQDRVLLLSTHLVEDVAELCPQMVILNQGKIVRSGSHTVLTKALKGKIWTKVVDDFEADNLLENCKLITSRMSRGSRCIRVLSDVQPDNNFQLAEPDLNDVYFTALLDEPEVQLDATITQSASAKS